MKTSITFKNKYFKVKDIVIQSKSIYHLKIHKMDEAARTEIYSQICGVHFPKENLKCFQLIPGDSTSPIVNDIINNIKQIQPAATNEKHIINIQNITKIDHSKKENWNLIKSLFRTDMASCMWMQDPSKFDAKTEYNLEEHINAYRIKLKYELLINLRDRLENYQKLVNEVAWHKMICWFNTGNTGTLDKRLNDCLTELTEMKREKVVKGVSLYDFVLKDKEKADKIALHRHESHGQSLMKYEIYRDIIGSAFEMAYQRAELIKEMEEQRVYSWTVNEQEVALDYGSVRYLANYLSDADIRNVIGIFNKAN